MKKTHILALTVFTMLIWVPALAQEECTVEQATQLELCKASCTESFPECSKKTLSIDEIREAISEKCNCDAARNYGKYRSCVAKLMNALKSFKLIDSETKDIINEDNKECRSAIKSRSKGKKNNNGKRPKLLK